MSAMCVVVVAAIRIAMTHFLVKVGSGRAIGRRPSTSPVSSTRRRTSSTSALARACLVVVEAYRFERCKAGWFDRPLHWKVLLTKSISFVDPRVSRFVSVAAWCLVTRCF